jgi:EEF1A lysine methyltransferase 2
LHAIDGNGNGDSDSNTPTAPGIDREISYASVLDLGTGNGSMLFMLRLQARYYGYMVGVDYSEQSVELARRLATEYSTPENLALSEEYEVPPVEAGCDTIQFERLDIIEEEAREQAWWPRGEDGKEDGRSDEGFDLVLDKGTFDAISLSAETVPSASPTSTTARIHTLYPARVIEMIKPGGFLLITSCNWTEAEVVRWFTTGQGVEGKLEVWGRIAYPVFEFGGQKGQGVASVCFQKRTER